MTYAIELTDVALCYRLAKQRIPSLKDYAIHWMKGALTYEKLWALRDVNLRVAPGETVGLIGANGAGKSSLLKVISRVLKPTRGRAQVRGHVAPILELGTGFDHELTGLENIYLNALLLGRSRREIDGVLDEIVDVSGLGDFVRTPIRNYSTGMIARLGFAVATAWIAEVLILDEVLAVGDAAFARTCEERIRRFHDAGSTVFLVSHNLGAVRANCARCVWLQSGSIAADGPAVEVVARYAASSAAPAAPALVVTP
jgi:ABC-2 type transport system ATP-binding protein/lipopolysaccharide transport system ATP-binding protein